MIAVSIMTSRTVSHGRKDIEEKAILRRAGKTKRGRRLRTMIPKLGRVLDAHCPLGLAGRSPAKISHRGLCITDPEKLVHG